MSYPISERYTKVIVQYYHYLAKRYKYKRNCRAFSKIIEEEFYIELTKEIKWS